MKISTDEKIINRILNKAVEEILPSKESFKELLMSGKRISVYQGFDPTAPTLHIGHTIMMRKLEDIRKLGHRVIFLIGDFTGRIGDPTDKKAARVKLTAEQIKENLKNYTEQASHIIDINNKENPVEVLFNNDWLGKLTFEDVIELASHFTVQQMIKRSMFQKRLEEDKPIYLHEFFYPLMQGYDSVAMDVDAELGGNDQLFNMLAGRTLMQELKGKNKFVVSGKLLTTPDGVKMGKSEGNMIMLSDTPENIFGKVMAMPDSQIVEGFELLTTYELDKVKEIEKELKSGTNPIELKKKLAYQITLEIKGEEGAKKAQKYFEEVFQNKDYSVDLEEKNLKGKILIEALVDECIVASKSEVRRLMEQGAVKIDDKAVTDTNFKIEGNVLKIGKKVFKIV